MQIKKPTLWLALTLVILLTAVPAQSQEADLSGTWTLTLLDKSATGARDGELKFERDGFNLEVTMSTDQGSAQSVGYIDGTEIRFYYVRASKKGDVVEAELPGGTFRFEILDFEFFEGV